MISSSSASSLGLLVGGVLGAVAGDEPVPSGGGVLLVLGGLVPGLVAGPPPAQRLGAGDGGAAGWRAGGAGQSRVSSATAFLAQASSTRSWPAAAAAMSAAVAALFRARGRPLETRCSRAIGVVGEQGFLAAGQRQVVAQVGG